MYIYIFFFNQKARAFMRLGLGNSLEWKNPTKPVDEFSTFSSVP